MRSERARRGWQTCSWWPSPQAGSRGQGTAAHPGPVVGKVAQLLLLLLSSPPGWRPWLYVDQCRARPGWSQRPGHEILNLRWGWMEGQVRDRGQGGGTKLWTASRPGPNWPNADIELAGDRGAGRVRGLRGAGRTHQPGSAPSGQLGGARSPGAWAARTRPCLGRPIGLRRGGRYQKKTLRGRR